MSYRTIASNAADRACVLPVLEQLNTWRDNHTTPGWAEFNGYPNWGDLFLDQQDMQRVAANRSAIPHVAGSAAMLGAETE